MSLRHRIVFAVSPNACEVTVGNKAMLLSCSAEKLEAAQERYDQGLYAQDAFDFLSADEREFLMTSLTPEDWDRLFPAEQD
jgi:UDP-N-acetylglucosamine pyrophosphorylase